MVNLEISLDGDETREYTFKFIPDETTNGSFRGYFLEIDGGFSRTMSSKYTPRLKVT